MRNKKQGRSFKKPKTLRGTITVTSRGVGYVSIEGVPEDVEIPPESLNTALHGDEVEVALSGKRFGRRQGEITGILKRAKKRFVGVLRRQEKFLYLVPDDKRVYTDILITPPYPRGAADGEKAFAEIVLWNDPKRDPEGKILKLLGSAGVHDVEMASIVLERGFDIEFPREVEREALEWKRRERDIFASERLQRRDFRSIPTFTIDPADAKDFDDAISFRALGADDFEIGVHIADVSHFVRDGSALDREARSRSFSVYLVDRTIPMLPEALSNDLCSLNPEEEKLAFSAVFRMNSKGAVASRWFGKTIIRSAKRFSYEEAQEALDRKTGPHAEALLTLNGIAKTLREEKWRAGAIDFEQDEVRFELDPAGRPIRVFKKARLDTHKLVEEMMLLANREAASFIAEKEKRRGKRLPFLYRIHDVPDREKIAQLAAFVRALGHELPITRGTVRGKDLQALFKKIEGEAEESVVKTSALRSMAKAIYSTENIGHFGLAFPYYTHFTSPIRRYPDLLVHRLLERELAGKAPSAERWSEYRAIAREASEKEIAAAEAERTSVKYKQVEYMGERIGQEFDGAISGVTEWGIYVEEMTTKSEGMVKLRDIGGDFFTLDEKKYRVVGERTKRAYSLGDRVRFRVAAADPERKTLDYALVEK